MTDRAIGSLNNPPREVMRTAVRSGGRIQRAQTRHDPDRGGRVLELTVFWPDPIGYDPADKPREATP